MAKQYRAAVIGLGRMGSTFDDEKSAWDRAPRPHAHTPCYRAAGVEVVAGADPHEGQREAYRRKWGIESLYADYREMLEREQPDILSICTTAKPRARILLDAVGTGASRGLKAIWAEKPIAISLAEADEMVAACQRAGIALAIGCSRAWSPMYNRMRELIDEGELGDLLQVIGFGQAGVSHNGSHLLTTVNRLAKGRVQWVFGHMESDEAAAGDVDLQGNCYLHYDNGVQGFVRMTACGGANWEIEVIGTQGVLRAIADAQQVQFYKTVASSLEGRRAEPAQHIFPLPAPATAAIRARCSISSRASRRARSQTVVATTGGTRWRWRLRCASRTGAAGRAWRCRWPTVRCTSARPKRCTETSRPSCGGRGGRTRRPGDATDRRHGRAKGGLEEQKGKVEQRSRAIQRV